MTPKKRISEAVQARRLDVRKELIDGHETLSRTKLISWLYKRYPEQHAYVRVTADRTVRELKSDNIIAPSSTKGVYKIIANGTQR